MAVFSAIASIGSAILGGNKAKQAASTQAEAAARAGAAQLEAARIASDTQLQMFEQTREDTAPWRETGARALTKLEDMFLNGKGMDDFQQTPGYQFRFDEGVRALDRSAASRGLLMSGGQQRELTRYGQGIASNEFNTYANRLSSLAGVGQSTAVQTGQMGATAAQAAGQMGMQGAAGAGNAMMQAGTARASGYVGQANAYSAGLGNLAGSLGMYAGLDPNSGIQQATAPNNPYFG